MQTKTVGQVIRQHLAREGRTQAALAKSLGVTQSTISRWITGDRRPWQQAHRRKLLAMGVDPRHL